MLQLRTLRSIESTTDQVAHQTVIVRVDYNVPLKGSSSDPATLQVADDQRLQSSRATIDFLLARGNKVILISHLGRPKDAPAAQYSLQPVANYLTAHHWWPTVQFSAAPIGSADLQATAAALQPGEILLLENLRFYPGEKKNDPEFVRQLAALADVYVNEAFSSSHRAHASVFGLAEALPAFAGLALTAEVTALDQVIDQPARPLVVVVGGAKISDKIDAVANLTKLADIVLVGGGVANNFIQAQGLPIYQSYVQDAVVGDASQAATDYVAVAAQIITDNQAERFLQAGYIPLNKVIYPIDVVAARSPEASQSQVITLDRRFAQTGAAATELFDLMYLDIGPKTIQLYSEIIRQAGTVFWNGPMGVFEQPPFAEGTQQIAAAIATAPGVTVLGGGDTIAAARRFAILDQVDYASTAGSAALEFLAGKPLPGLEVLRTDL